MGGGNLKTEILVAETLRTVYRRRGRERKKVQNTRGLRHVSETMQSKVAGILGEFYDNLAYIARIVPFDSCIGSNFPGAGGGAQLGVMFVTPVQP
jgi:hypothetical protein